MRRARFLPTGCTAFALDARALGAEFPVQGAKDQPFEVVGQAAVIDIAGPLTEHPVEAIDPFTGKTFVPFDCYDAIRARATAAFGSEASIVCLRINSPGGEAAGCMELARDLRAMAMTTGKRLVAYADGQAASAAYAIACAAETIGAPPTANVGSIGIFETLLDSTAQDKQLGLLFTLVASGDRKLDSNPHQPKSREAVAFVQDRVDLLAGMFFDLVAELRGIPADEVKAMQGAVWLAPQARVKGLIDFEMTWGELLASPQADAKGTAMAKMKDVLAGLAEIANGADGDEKETARKMLASHYGKADDGDGDKDKPDDKKDGEAKAEGGDDKKDEKKDPPKAQASEEDKKDEPKAQASTGLEARVQAIETREAAAAQASERAKLLSTRPDFSAEVLESLKGAPLAFVKDACAKWPKVATRKAPANPAAEASVGGTRGDGQGDVEGEAAGDKTEADFIARKMGGAQASDGIKSKDNALELGFLTPAEASKRLAELEKSGA